MRRAVPGNLGEIVYGLSDTAMLCSPAETSNSQPASGCTDAVLPVRVSDLRPEALGTGMPTSEMVKELALLELDRQFGTKEKILLNDEFWAV